MTQSTGAPPQGSYPKGLYAVYRGRLVKDPKEVTRGRDKPPTVSARMAVAMASSKVPLEQRDTLTEWVNVLAFGARVRHLLMQCSKGQTIAVTGNVTCELRTLRSGEEIAERTIIAEDLMGVAASLQPNVSHPADMDAGIKAALATATEDKPTRTPIPEGGAVELD